jgi:steroid 5-alpha reductase family enzyme
MTVATLLIDNFAILAAVFVLLWLLSIALKDASFVDIWWAFGMVFLAGLSFFETGPPSLRKYLLLGLCALWGLRLGFYILWRWLKHGPDQRYVAMLESRQKKHGWSFAKTSGLIVFTLQMPLQFIVALPVQLGMASPEPAGIGIVGWIGVALSAFGIVFESIADFHLAIFKANPANKGKVLDSGVWRTTRHPNFFGEACAWWGLYLIAAETTAGLWALPGPILITFLLTRFSGVPTVEESMHAKRPGYEAYVKRTSGFIPWFPKKI